jgi:hypothetical protein
MSDTSASCHLCKQTLPPNQLHLSICLNCVCFLAQGLKALGKDGQLVTRENLDRCCHAVVRLLSHRAALLKSAGIPLIGCERFLHEAVPDGLDMGEGPDGDYRKWNCLSPNTLPDCALKDILDQSRWLQPFLSGKDGYPSRIVAARVIIRGWRKALLQIELLGKPKLPDEIPILQVAEVVVDQVRCCLAEQLEPKAAVPSNGSAAAAERCAPRDNRPKRINAKMLEVIQNNHEAMGWNSRKWAEHLRCSKSAVVETQTWKDLGMRRDRERAERRKDRRRKRAK